MNFNLAFQMLLILSSLAILGLVFRKLPVVAGRMAAEAILGGGQLGFTLAFNHHPRPPKPQSLAQVFGDINQVRTRTGYTSRIITRWRSEFGID